MSPSSRSLESHQGICCHELVAYSERSSAQMLAGTDASVEACRDESLRRLPSAGCLPAAEQRAIADFLDRKTAAIDALIAKKERLIELLAGEAAGAHHAGRDQGAGLDRADEGLGTSLDWLDPGALARP